MEKQDPELCATAYAIIIKALEENGLRIQDFVEIKYDKSKMLKSPDRHASTRREVNIEIVPPDFDENGKPDSTPTISLVIYDARGEPKWNLTVRMDDVDSWGILYEGNESYRGPKPDLNLRKSFTLVDTPKATDIIRRLIAFYKSCPE